MRSHGDAVALNNTFYQILTAGDAQPKSLRDIRTRCSLMAQLFLKHIEVSVIRLYRCLSPGMYAHHLDRWLLYYPPQQISIIDGEQLRLDPVTTMTKLQHFLKIRPIFDYSLHLR